jgi:hypothetical protein
VTGPATASDTTDLVSTARATLAVHVDDGGFCRGCHHHFGQLKPHPCEQARWAAAVIEGAMPFTGHERQPAHGPGQAALAPRR